MKARRPAKRSNKIKRSGFVYSLYKKNIIALWVLALALLAMFTAMMVKSGNYLLNYLFYRREPDPASLTAFLEKDMLDIPAVSADIQKNGGEMALDRQRSAMFFKDNVYQEGSRYRFSLPLDAEKLTDTGIYYDETGRAYLDVPDRETLKTLIPRENYCTDHLYFYDYEGIRVLLVLDYEAELELPESLRVTLAPMGVYSVYMVQDLHDGGYDDPIPNYFIDGRNTPVDFEDDDFKDLVMVFPFVLLTLIPAILFTVFPLWHPTYRQLNKFARTTQKAVEQVDRDYEEYGILSEDKKTWYLNDWLVKRSTFKNGIEKNYKKQKY